MLVSALREAQTLATLHNLPGYRLRPVVFLCIFIAYLLEWTYYAKENISTQEATCRQSARFSRPYGDEIGAKCPETPPRQTAQGVIKRRNALGNPWACFCLAPFRAKMNGMKTEKSLKQLMAEFEAVVAWFDGENLDVEAAIKQFEKGNRLAEQIKKQLETAKNQIEVVKKSFEQ
jgi:exodeoxyribonuclease VII small subunit